MSSGTKKNFYGPNIAPKNYGFKKKNLIVFRAKNCGAKKRYGFQKKGTHTFFLPGPT